MQDYISRCETAIGKFESLVNQIQKNARDIDSRIQLIENLNLFKPYPPKVGGYLPSVKASPQSVKISDHPLLFLYLTQLFMPKFTIFLFNHRQVYLEFVESERIKDLDILSRKYRAIGPLLTKMEGLVAHTNSGRSKQLAKYYEYWEQRIFDGLGNMVVRNLADFNRSKESSICFCPLSQLTRVVTF